MRTSSIFIMSRFIVTLLFALCILKYARTEPVPKLLNEIENLRNEFEAILNDFQDYIDKSLNEVTDAQDTIQKEFMAELKNKISPIADEIENGSLEEDNYAKIKCMRAAKEKIDYFESALPAIVQECIDREEKEELNNLFNAMLDRAAIGQKIMFSSIKSLENAVKTSNYGNLNASVLKKIHGTKALLNLLKEVVHSWMKEGNETIKKAKNQSKECSNEQLEIIHSSILEIYNSCVVAL